MSEAMAAPALRLIDYKKHPGLPGNWRVRPVRYGSHVLEVELPCINGLPAWFTVATFHAAEDAERLMTDGARMEAGEYAARIAAAMQDRRAERADALEEAATLCERKADYSDMCEEELQIAAQKIRALKDKPLPPKADE